MFKIGDIVRVLRPHYSNCNSLPQLDWEAAIGHTYIVTRVSGSTGSVNLADSPGLYWLWPAVHITYANKHPVEVF